MKTIRVSTDFGTNLSSRTMAAKLRVQIEAAVNAGQSVTVDLTDVDSISESFADEAFAVLVTKRGSIWFRKGVKLKGLGASQRDTVLGAILERRARAGVRVG